MDRSRDQKATGSIGESIPASSTPGILTQMSIKTGGVITSQTLLGQVLVLSPEKEVFHWLHIVLFTV